MQPPDDALLLAYLDGELDPAAQKRLEKQIEGSWELRARLAALERDIADCVELLGAPPESAFAPAAEVWHTIEPRLTHPRPRPWRRWMLVASLVLAAGLATYLRLDRVPTISAAETVARAIDAEADSLHRVKRPVVHRRMLVRKLTARETRALDWELWTDTATGRVHQIPEADAGNRAMLGNLRHVLDRNHLDSRRPLSSSAWAEWRRTVTPRQEHVERAPGTISIETRMNATGDDEAFVAARLTVRASDWAPVEQSFTVNDVDGPSTFEIRETASAVLAFQSLPAGMFETERAPRVIAQEPLPPAPEPAPEQPADVVDRAALTASMLAVNTALHRTGLCGEEPLPELEISGGRLDVRGTLHSTARKSQLLDALGDIPLLRLDLQVADTAAARPAARLLRLPGDHDSEAAAASLQSLFAAIRADAAALAWHVRHAPEGALDAEPLRRVVEEHHTALGANMAEAAALLGPSAGAGAPLPFSAGGTMRDRMLTLAEAASRVVDDPALSAADVRASLLALSAAVHGK